MWGAYTLDQLGYVGRGRSRHRPRNDPKLYGGETPFIQTADIQSALVRISSYSQTYSEEGVAQSKVWDQPTLCLTIAGENTGSTAILDFPACFPDSIVGFVPDPEKADLIFVKHALDAMRSQFRMVSKGATQDNLSLEKILSFPLRVPSLAVQRKIASIVGGYNDMIENNRRRIALLEEAARMLYREWFVHLRFPDHEHVKIIDGLPEGWELRSVAELAELKGGKQIENGLIATTGDIPVYGGNGIQGYTDRKTQDGFVIAFGRVGAYCGSVHWSYRGAWINNNASSLVPNEYQELVLHHLLGCDFTNFRKGAAQPFIPNGMLSTIAFKMPPDGLALAFCEYARDYRLQQVNLNLQNQKLAEARDLLLPRLMNGEIAV